MQATTHWGHLKLCEDHVSRDHTQKALRPDRNIVRFLTLYGISVLSGGKGGYINEFTFMQSITAINIIITSSNNSVC